MSKLLALLQEEGTTLITANTRLMQFYQDSYKRMQQEKQSFVFKKPAIFSADIWLEKCWQKCRYQHAVSLIQNYQAHFLWEEIINKNNDFFFNIDGIIEEVKRAWNLCCAWNIDINEKDFSINTDTKSFFHWAFQYKKNLEKNHWIDFSILPILLAQTVLESHQKEKKFILVGFNRISPQFMECVKHFSSSDPIFYESEEKAKIVYKQAFFSEEEEIQTFLNYAKNLDSRKKIACVIPNLSEKRIKLERWIQRYFSDNQYNISTGHIFSSFPIVETALKILTIKRKLYAEQAIELKDFYFLLEDSMTLKLLHKTENAKLSWKNFLFFLEKNQLEFSERLKRFENFSLPDTAKPSEWIEIFQALLFEINWLENLDSESSQIYERWLKLLNEYQQLDLIFSTITFEQALNALKKMANYIIFQSKKSEVSLQFLDPLEATGLHFDVFWVMGMSAEKIPGKIQLNSFIPAWIQCQKELPHATHEIEWSFGKKLMQDFMSGGKDVIFSYAIQKEGIALKESPFLANIKSSLPPVLAKDKYKNEDFFESIQDNESIVCQPNENIKGGTTLIKNQALCPFRAFAKHRLQALGFEKLTTGLAAHERGNLVHDALERFWAVTQTQQKLFAYSSEELKNLTLKTATTSVKKWIKSSPEKADKLPDFFQKLEIQRLATLLNKWLEFEKQRPNFKIIALEEKQTLKLSELELKIRVDRIDQLSDGKKLVIDYKTGALPALLSDDERPENPQLLLYALSDSDVKAWSFAQVKSAELKFKGKSAEETDISGIKSIDWETERQHWEKTLISLANEFLEGNNQALPKKEEVCKQCDLQGLCRIKEMS